MKNDIDIWKLIYYYVNTYQIKMVLKNKKKGYFIKYFRKQGIFKMV